MNRPAVTGVVATDGPVAAPATVEVPITATVCGMARSGPLFDANLSSNCTQLVAALAYPTMDLLRALLTTLGLRAFNQANGARVAVIGVLERDPTETLTLPRIEPTT